MKNKVKVLLESILTEATKEDNINLIKQVLQTNPNLTFNELLGKFNIVPGSSKQIAIYTALTSGLKNGEIAREKDGKSFRYQIGTGTPAANYTPRIKSTTPKIPKVGKREEKKNQLLELIRSDFRYFNPGRSWMKTDPEIDGDIVSKSYRSLGNWINNEEDRYDNDFHESDWEDNDQRIWAKGEYKKYMKLFKDWVSTKSWKKYVTIEIITSEKDWCYFEIKLK